MGDSTIILVACLICLIFGITVGSASIDKAWQNDCETMGVHRTNKIVYKCSVGVEK